MEPGILVASLRPLKGLFQNNIQELVNLMSPVHIDSSLPQFWETRGWVPRLRDCRSREKASDLMLA